MNIKLENVSYTYNPGTPNSSSALKEINLEIEGSGLIALIGNTGSGKSTLIQMFNGLLKPDSGNIYFDGINIYNKLELEGAGKKDKEKAKNEKQALKELRRKAGLVFQYPEYQLFEETVIKDVMYGPKNLGFSEEESRQRAEKALTQTGIMEESFEKSPFDLSGGEKRRVAIAGVLAMEPEVLILDEPTAGLDPKGRIDILECIQSIQKEKGQTVIFVSHTMEEVAEYADRIIAMYKGRIVLDGSVHEIFSDTGRLEQFELMAPEITYFCRELGINGVTTVDEAVTEILKKYA